MKPYSIELREKIVKIYEQGDTSIRKVAARFDVSKGFVQTILKYKQTTGRVQPRKQRGSPKRVLNSRRTELTQMGEKYPESIVVRILGILAFELYENVQSKLINNLPAHKRAAIEPLRLNP
ncbi:hypothetical protein [Oscillatoria nigro-viridis]|uniref:hypothetical protein n=1 Tax=Phormidium nigroviride TaxID=482564 RepID=UPI0006853388|nr:hypothetical protein [Oscillatoria nigro-viridis]